MKQLIFPLLLILLAACDNPQRTRMSPAPGQNAYNANTGFGQNGGFQDPLNQGGGSTGSSGSGTTGNGLGSGFENCTFSPTHYASGMGHVAVCKSTVTETSVAIRTSLTDTATRTCLIPTYKDSAGASTYLGQPQCFYQEQNKAVVGSLYKTRQGFSNYQLNGVMIMKENSLTAYYGCMDSYVNYKTAQCPYGPQTSPYCDSQAKSYMAQVCNNFKAMHSYLDLAL